MGTVIPFSVLDEPKGRLRIARTCARKLWIVDFAGGGAVLRRYPRLDSAARTAGRFLSAVDAGHAFGAMLEQLRLSGCLDLDGCVTVFGWLAPLADLASPQAWSEMKERWVCSNSSAQAMGKELSCERRWWKRPEDEPWLSGFDLEHARSLLWYQWVNSAPKPDCSFSRLFSAYTLGVRLARLSQPDD